MTRFSDTNHPRRVQYAALPYRQRQDGEVQVRLVTSRETRRWVIPKGWPMKGIPPHKAAAREAFEEAGLLGATSRTAFGLYTYEKRLSATRSVICDVMVFPMKVKRYLKKWPERTQRIGFWFTIKSAAAAVQEEELRGLILRFGEVMAARFAAKQQKGTEVPDAGAPAVAKTKKAAARDTAEEQPAITKTVSGAQKADKTKEAPARAASPAPKKGAGTSQPTSH